MTSYVIHIRECGSPILSLSNGMGEPHFCVHAIYRRKTFLLDVAIHHYHDVVEIRFNESMVIVQNPVDDVIMFVVADTEPSHSPDLVPFPVRRHNRTEHEI